MKDLEQVLACAIGTDGFTDGSVAADSVTLFECIACFEREVSHLIERDNPTDIEPFGELFAREFLQTDGKCDVLQFGKCFA